MDSKSAAVPPYPQPEYPTAPMYPPPQYAAQTTYVVQPVGSQPVFVANGQFMSFTGAILLSCFVYWCCGAIFGLVAFILALVGQSSASNGDVQSARPLLISSYVMSAVGIIAGIIMIIILSIFITANVRNCSLYGRC